MINPVKKTRRLLGIAATVANHPLHREHRTRALLRWVSLMVSSRLTPTRQIAVPYVGGSILNWPNESSSVGICARYGLGEYADMAFLLHALREGDLFCDIGANAGVYTVLAGKAVGCSVVAIEPIPNTFDLLMQNVYANHIAGKVDARNIGVGSGVSKLNFTSDLWSFNHVVEAAGTQTISVDVLPLDAVLASRIPYAIKMDVEGFEEQVILGGSSTISDPALQAVVIEIWGEHLARYDGSVDRVLQALRNAGLQGPFWYEPENRELIPPGQQDKQKYNQIFVRDAGAIMERIKTARAYEINGAHV